MQDLIFKYAKRNISDGTYGFSLEEDSDKLLLNWKDESESKVSVKDVMGVKKSTFLAWFFASPILCNFKVKYLHLLFKL